MKESKLAKLRAVLTKPSKSNSDLRFIHELLSQTPLKSNFFHQIMILGKKESFMLDICKGFKYKFYPKGKVIFEESDTNTNYLYIVIKGQVGVFIRNVLQSAIMKSKKNPPLSEISKQLTKTGSIQSNIDLLSDHQRSSFKVKIRPLQESIISRRQSSVIAKIRASVQMPRRSGLRYQYQKNQSVIHPEILENRCETNKNSIVFDGAIFGSKPKPRERKVSTIHSITREKTEDFFINDDEIMKTISMHNLFNPENEEQLAKLKFFEQNYINDRIPLSAEDEEKFTKTYGNKVREMKEWAIFGELAQETAKPRTATIITLANTEVIRINQVAYQNIIKNALKIKKALMVEFICKVLFISKKPTDRQIVASILPSVDKIKIKKGEVFIMQGDPHDNLYLIKKGEVKLSKLVKDEPNSMAYEKIDPQVYEEIIAKLNGQLIPVGICSSNEFVGEELIFAENLASEFNYECLSFKATIVRIKSELVASLPHRITEAWRDIYERRKAFREMQFRKTTSLLISLQLQMNSYDIFGRSRNEKNSFNETQNGTLTDNMCRTTKSNILSKRIDAIFKQYKEKKNLEVNEIIDFSTLGEELKPRNIAPVKRPSHLIRSSLHLLPKTQTTPHSFVQGNWTPRQSNKSQFIRSSSIMVRVKSSTIGPLLAVSPHD